MKIHICILSSLIFFSVQSAGQNIGGLKKHISEKNLSEKGKILFETGDSHLKKREIDSSLKYTAQAVKFLNSDFDLSNGYENLGMAYFFKNDFKNALENFKQSLFYAERLKNDSIIGRRFSDLGVVYDYLGAYDNATENYLKAVKLFEKANDKYGIAKVYNNLGIINETAGKYTTALNYYHKSLQLKQKTGTNEAETASTYVNIGSVNEKMNKYDDALKNYEKALLIYRKNNIDKYTALCYNNIADIYEKQRKYEDAKRIIKKALSLSENSAGNLNFAKSHLISARINRSEKKYKNALNDLNIAENIADRLGITNIKNDILKEYTNLYEAENNFRKAFYTQKQYLKIKNSLISEKINEKTEHLQIVYETDKKEQTIQNLKNNLIKKRILWTSAVIILLIISGLVFMILRNKLHKSKLDNYIFNQKLLRSQMNPHFIFNALNSVQSFMLENDTKNAAIYLSAFSKLMRSVLNNSRNEFVTLREETETIENYLKIQQLRMSNVFDYEIKTDTNIDTDYYLVPPMLVQPFIENSIIHAFKDIDRKGLISIYFGKENKHIIISVKDSGKGVSKTKINKAHKSQATEITNERLKLLKKQYKTKITFTVTDISDNAVKTGTEVRFILPLIKNTENV